MAAGITPAEGFVPPGPPDRGVVELENVFLIAGLAELLFVDWF